MGWDLKKCRREIIKMPVGIFGREKSGYIGQIYNRGIDKFSGFTCCYKRNMGFGIRQALGCTSFFPHSWNFLE